MKLFCAVCEKEVTDNIAVFENVDGVIVHCGECNYPLLFVPYDEPGWFGNPVEGPQDVSGNSKPIVEDHLNLFEEQLDLFESGCDCTDCDDCTNQPDADDLDNVAFTADDINYMYELLAEDIEILNKRYDQLTEILETPIDCNCHSCSLTEAIAAKSSRNIVVDRYKHAVELQNKLITIKEMRK